MSKREIILASTSRHRRNLLDRLGLSSILSVAPRCHEDVEDPSMKPVNLVQLLARRKAVSVAEDHPNALVIGSDQVAELDGEILGKPGTSDRALAQLEKLAGREHRLLTGLCVYDPLHQQYEEGVAVHRMKMWPHERATLRKYVDFDQPLDCAGSYRVESAGVMLFESMAGEDYTAIVGLPLCLLSALLRRFGVILMDSVQ